MNRRTLLASAVLILVGAGFLALLAGAHALHTPVNAPPHQPARLAALPTLVLWAWERPEDLHFLDPDRAAVAFLAKTITLPSPTAAPFIHSRLQPLRVPPATQLIAVVRIESPPNHPLNAPQRLISTDLRAQIATQIAALQSIPAVRAIQIDFDATLSERDFYAALLQDVRRQLRPDLPLSITALASWCIGDSWLDTLPTGTIDEAVPMLFRMGAGSAEVANFLRSNQKFRASTCNASLGLSIDETLSRSILAGESTNALASRTQKRIYVFAPHPWTQREANSLLQELQP